MARHRFDPTQDHGQVCGGSVRLFEQNGIHFNMNHEPVQLMPDGMTVVPLKMDEPLADQATPDSYASMTTDELKQLCTVYDIEFKTRAQAIKALEGA